MRGLTIPIALAMLAGTAGSTARAQSADVSTEASQMTLPAGKVFIQVFAEMNLSTDLVLKPLSIAPDIWYGVSDALGVGIIHSARGATGFFGGVGNGICLTGEENGCAKLYDNVGVDARYQFYRSGAMTMAADGGLFVGSFDPLLLAVKVGVVGRWQSGKLAVELAPSVFLGVTERDGGNKETAYLPFTVLFGLSPSLSVAAQAGVAVPIEDAADLFTVQASVGAGYMVSSSLSIDAAFSLPALAGGDLQPVTGFDLRTFTLGGSYAL